MLPNPIEEKKNEKLSFLISSKILHPGIEVERETVEMVEPL